MGHVNKVMKGYDRCMHDCILLGGFISSKKKNNRETQLSVEEFESAYGNPWPSFQVYMTFEFSNSSQMLA